MRAATRHCRRIASSRLRGIVAGFLLLTAGCIAGEGPPTATNTYVFLPAHTKVTLTGGIAGVNETYRLQGHFRLAMDPDAGTASFTCVDATVTDDRPDRGTFDLGWIFNMTDLVGTILGDGSIRFDGKTGKNWQPARVVIRLTLKDGSLTLAGRTTHPLRRCYDCFELSMDALAQRKYSGGTGELNDPYQIATAADLIALGGSHDDYDKHFLLTANIDLAPNLPGRRVFDKAVIAPDTDAVKSGFQGTPFTGVFDGHRHTISHLTIKGTDYLGLFGLLDSKAHVGNLGVVDVNITGRGEYVGGLVGDNDGDMTQCYSTGAVGGL